MPLGQLLRGSGPWALHRGCRAGKHPCWKPKGGGRTLVPLGCCKWGRCSQRVKCNSWEGDFRAVSFCSDQHLPNSDVCVNPSCPGCTEPLLSRGFWCKQLKVTAVTGTAWPGWKRDSHSLCEPATRLRPSLGHCGAGIGPGMGPQGPALPLHRHPCAGWVLGWFAQPQIQTLKR